MVSGNVFLVVCLLASLSLGLSIALVYWVCMEKWRWRRRLRDLYQVLETGWFPEDNALARLRQAKLLVRGWLSGREPVRPSEAMHLIWNGRRRPVGFEKREGA